MHQFNKMKKTSMAIMSLLVSIAAHAAPDEALKQTLSRTEKSGLVLQSQLKKNTYRQEPYEASYTVEVPYQATETYYVDVPYQDTETYTDYEDYYTSEQVCNTYTDYERQCHDERRCNYSLQTGDALKAVILRERAPGTGPAPYEPPGGGGGSPGGGNHGGGGGGYEPPSRPEPRPEPVCRNEEVCNNIPVTKQRCGYEQVRHQRPVTKTRTVTRYTREERTREVTRYRTESRCCVTKYNEVFDHQWAVDVELQFPTGTELLANEQEQFKIELSGEESNPEVKVTPVTAVFGYLVADKKVSGKKVIVTLSEIPRYAAADLKEKTLQNFQAVSTRAGLTYRFLDNALFPRVTSVQRVLVREASTKKVIAQSEFKAISQRENSGSLELNWEPSLKYEIALQIQRTGKVIAEGKVEFEVVSPIEMLVDEAALKSSSNVTMKISGRKSSATLVLKDATIPYSSIVTKYEITLSRKNWLGMKKYIGDGTISRTSLKTNEAGAYSISVKDLGVSSSEAEEYLSSGSNVLIELTVTRTKSDGTKIRFSKESKVEI
jgi:hypothetical protein